MLSPLADAQAFDAALAQPGVVVVEFGGPSCVACRALEPMLAEVVATTGARGYSVNAESDAAMPLVARFAVRSRPTVLIVRDGVVRQRLVGKLPRSEYERLIGMV